MNIRRAIVSCLLYAAGQLSMGLIHAQSSSLPAVTGPYDKGFSFPIAVKQLGEKDEVAAQIVRAYLRAVGVSAPSSFCAAGTITFGVSSTSDSSVSAHLAIGPAENQERLDITTPKGGKSIRFHGAIAGILQSDGMVTQFPAMSAAAGLFVTSNEILKATDDPNISLSDGGTVVVDGNTYHEITYGRPLPGFARPSKPTPTLATSLFFDPNTHLLLKAADVVPLSGSSHVRRLRVISFGNYQATSAGMQPFSITETRDGQLVWQLSLTTVENSCDQPSGYFALTGGAR